MAVTKVAPANSASVADSRDSERCKQAKAYIKKVICNLYGVGELRVLIATPVYARYDEFSGIVFSLEGSPTQGTLFAKPWSWDGGRPDKFKVVCIEKVVEVKDERLQEAIAIFIEDMKIPLLGPSHHLRKSEQA